MSNLNFPMRSVAAGVALSVSLLLSGCVKLAVDLSVSQSDEVSGTIIFAYPKAMSLLIESNDALEGLRESYRSIDGAIERGYQQDGMTGTEIRLKEVPIADFSAPQNGEPPLKIMRFGDEIHVDGLFDLSAVEPPRRTSGDSFTATISSGDTDAMFVAVVLPGTITSTNGLVDEGKNRVYWAIEAGQSNEIFAVAVSPEPTPGWLWWTIFFGVSGLATLAFFIVSRISRSNHARGRYPTDTAQPTE